jgi:hypothetical protein
LPVPVFLPRELFDSKVGLDNQPDNLPPLFPELAPQSALMVAGKVPDDRLEIDRKVHGPFVDREMRIRAIFSYLYLPELRKQGGFPPASTKRKITK